MPRELRIYQGGKIDKPHLHTNYIGKKVILIPDATGYPHSFIGTLDHLASWIKQGKSIRGLAIYLKAIGITPGKELVARYIRNYTIPRNKKVLTDGNQFLIIEKVRIPGDTGTMLIANVVNLSNLTNGLAIWRCNCCMNYFLNSAERYFDYANRVICEDCIEGYSSCNNCEALVLETDEDGHCPSCHIEREDETDLNDVQEYGFSPPLEFFGDKNRSAYPFYVGMELEVNTEKPVTVLRHVRQKYGDFFYGVNDSSINGVELISMPATIEHWKKFSFPSHPSITGGPAGIHLHICRSGFNHSQLFNILTLFKRNRTFVKTIAQRDEEMDRWAHIWDGQEIRAANNYGDLRSYIGGDKYSAINFKHCKTLEFRIFNSTTQDHLIQKNIEFVASLWKWTKEGNIGGDIDLSSYLDFSSKEDYPNLNRFISANVPNLLFSETETADENETINENEEN